MKGLDDIEKKARETLDDCHDYGALLRFRYIDVQGYAQVTMDLVAEIRRLQEVERSYEALLKDSEWCRG